MQSFWAMSQAVLQMWPPLAHTSEGGRLATMSTDKRAAGIIV